MEKPADQTYESKTVVGWIYRESKAAAATLHTNAGAAGAANPDATRAQGAAGPSDRRRPAAVLAAAAAKAAEPPVEAKAKPNHRPDPRLLYPGHEGQLPIAKLTFRRYKADLLKLMHQFGVYNDAEVMSSHVFEFSRSKHNAARHKDFQERLDQAIAKLRCKYHTVFCNGLPADAGEGTRAGSPAELAKASAWYRACYEAEQTDVVVLSFPWICLPLMKELLAGSPARK